MLVIENIDHQFAHAFGLHQQHQLPQAALAYEEVLKSSPQHDKSLYMLGYIAGQQGNFSKALTYFEKAISINSHSSVYFLNRGNAHRKLYQLEAAVRDYDKSIELNPDVSEAYLARATAKHERKDLIQAVADYSLAISMNPECAEAFFNMGQALQQLKQADSASISFFKALEIKPDFDFLLGTCLHSKMKLCDWENLGEGLNILEAEVSSLKKVTTPFAALSLIDNPKLHFQAAQTYGNSKFPSNHLLGPIPKRNPKDRIRVGYFSADFHNHATSYLMAELFEAHDRFKFEIYGFSFGSNTQDEMRNRLSKGFDKFLDVSKLPDSEIAQLSRDFEIDIAIDLKGYTEDSRTEVFAYRCAPIQVNYLGYPGTMGVDYMDYVIADPIVISESNVDSFTEKIAYLPNCYQVNDSKRKISDKQFTRSNCGLPGKGFVFCCFNNGYKIQPQTFQIWMRILQSVEGSVLWLYEDNSTASVNLRQEAERLGVDSNRLIFAPRLAMDEHLARHCMADLFLDTLPYNAHTTASDALWAGVPVLTCMGKSFAGKVAASLLNTIDLPELITYNEQKYEEKAVQIANDPQFLNSLKTRLSINKTTSPLFNIGQFTSHFEATLTKMYAVYQSGDEVGHIVIKDIGVNPKVFCGQN
jgi:predicted O-linked N-acetylglucosamine transferase (SPINDLY family)